MVYVYRQQSSAGARELATALNGRRVRRIAAHNPRRGDYIVCWGEHIQPPPGVRVLNNAAIRSKFADAQILERAGVPTIEVQRTAPGAATAAPDPALPIFQEVVELAADFGELAAPARSQPFRDGLRTLLAGLGRLQTVLQAPLPELQAVEWLPRVNDHVGGSDLLTPPRQPDYWVKKLEFAREFRIHSFQGKSLRAGVKAPREGYVIPTGRGGEGQGVTYVRGQNAAHAWVRSWDGGWRILYDGVSSKKKHRAVAHAAVAALGLDFGAVDIGEKADGSLVVLEVNRAPGVEGGTVNVYADAIRRWMAE